MDLVTKIVNSKWRQRRLYTIETDLNEQQMEKQKPEIEAAYKSYPESVEHAFAFRTLSESGCLAMLIRVESGLERTYSHALQAATPPRKTNRIPRTHTCSQNRARQQAILPTGHSCESKSTNQTRTQTVRIGTKKLRSRRHAE